MSSATLCLEIDENDNYRLLMSHDCLDSDADDAKQTRLIDEEVPLGDYFKVLSEEPLTISQAIACKRCGFHYKMVEGKWELPL